MILCAIEYLLPRLYMIYYISPWMRRRNEASALSRQQYAFPPRGFTLYSALQKDLASDIDGGGVKTLRAALIIVVAHDGSLPPDGRLARLMGQGA